VIVTLPVAVIAAPAAACPGEQLSFGGGGSHDADGKVTSFTWSFGDGATATGSSVSHEYAAPGAFTVTLTVTDSAGNTSSAVRSLLVAFPPPPDLDGDGFPSTTDCNDGDAAINPSAVEILDNAVDENCDGIAQIDFDRDRDGVNRPRDCNDGDARIRPGAVDVPLDGIDQDCADGDAPAPRIPTNIRATFSGRPGYVAFNTLFLTPAVAGSRVRITCKGPGCPKREWKRRIKKASARVSLLRLVRKVKLDRRTTVEMRVTAPRMLGVAARWRGLAPSRTDLCFSAPTTKKPKKCRPA